MKASELAAQFEMTNRELTNYTRDKAKQVAKEVSETIEKVHRRFKIDPVPVTLLTWVMSFLTDLNIEFKLITGEKMLQEVRAMMGKRAEALGKKARSPRKRHVETDVT